MSWTEPLCFAWCRSCNSYSNDTAKMNGKENVSHKPGKIARFFVHIHDAFAIVIRFFKEAFVPPFHFKEFIRQCFNVGYKSLALISITGILLKYSAIISCYAILLHCPATTYKLLTSTKSYKLLYYFTTSYFTTSYNH